MADDFSPSIRATEKRRCAAMVANDVTTLDALLDPRLQFHHATGAADNKDAYLAKMASGRIEYVAIRWEEERVTPLAADAALLTGRMITDVRVDGATKQLNNRVTTVWVRDDGEWRLIVFQSTPIAA